MLVDNGELPEEIAGPKTRQLILQADPKTPYETVITVMDYTRELVPVDPEAPGPDADRDLFPKVHFSMGFK